jgi:hypothetical protein
MFGRKKSGVEAQKATLAAVSPDIAEISALLAKAKSRQKYLAEQPNFEVVLRGAEAMTGLYADMTRHFETATIEHAQFDASISAMRLGISDQRPLLFYFTVLGDGYLLAEQNGKTARSNKDAWLSLLDYADNQVAAMRDQIAELAELKEKHLSIWPAKLNLEAMRGGTDDAANALALYRERVSADGDLAPVSAESVGKIIGMLANSVEIINRSRQELAVTIISIAGLKQSQSDE